MKWGQTEMKMGWSWNSDEVNHKLDNSKISIDSDIASSSIRETNTFVE